ncbi:integrase [Streptomyces sp. cg35]|uniref:integrase n=1 Tax=Streptomyces sp. cg35 TaxID=3421650 RepID=UPI003D1729CA
MSDRDKDAEVLALRHQFTVLERPLGADRVKLAPEVRVFLAALLVPLRRQGLRRLQLLARPDTVPRRHRDLTKRRHVRTCRPKRPGRPPTIRSIRMLILRLVRENPSWGYRRVHGELATLGIQIAAFTTLEVLTREGIDPAPERAATTWADFLRSQADALLACDLIQTVPLTGRRQYILAIIEHATRRIRILGTTARPSAAWVTQTARNLAIDRTDAQATVAYLIRDRDAKYPALFDEILANAGIQVVRTGIRIPRMNALMERWVQTCRHELLDRTLIWNERHLHHALHQLHQLHLTLQYDRGARAHGPHAVVGHDRRGWWRARHTRWRRGTQPGPTASWPSTSWWRSPAARARCWSTASAATCRPAPNSPW